LEAEESSWIEVELYYLGYHQWKEAPPHRAYLEPKHQHMFKITARLSVTHLDRDIEFHDLRDFLWDELHKFKFEGSCEMMAEKLFRILTQRYKNHKISVVVEEEGGLKGKYGNVVV